MKRKHREEHQRKKRRRRGIKDRKSEEKEQREKGEQRDNGGAGKNATQERGDTLVPVREKLFFRCSVVQKKKKKGKKIKIHEVGEDLRVMREENSD